MGPSWGRLRQTPLDNSLSPTAWKKFHFHFHFHFQNQVTFTFISHFPVSHHVPPNPPLHRGRSCLPISLPARVYGLVCFLCWRPDQILIKKKMCCNLPKGNEQWEGDTGSAPSVWLPLTFLPSTCAHTQTHDRIFKGPGGERARKGIAEGMHAGTRGSR